MIRLISICLTGWALAAAADAAPLRRCGGGDGPKPMSDISGTFPTDLHRVPTDGQPEEFLVWEKRHRLVYRNQNGQILMTDIGGDQATYLATSFQPLSRIVDAQERFILTAFDSYFLDVATGLGFRHYQAPFAPSAHLFWHGSTLFSFASHVSADGQQTLKLFRYDAGAPAAHRICPSLKFKTGEGYHVGEGHDYPSVFLYRSKRTPNGTELSTFKLDVETCQIDQSTYADYLEGNVQNVYWFKDLDSVAVKIDHPTKNLMWDTGPDSEHCQFFNIGESPVFRLNGRLPVIGTFDRDLGFKLLWLGKTHAETSKTAGLLREVPIRALRPQDIWLSQDAKTLFVLPQLFDASRYLLALDMPRGFGGRSAPVPEHPAHPAQH